MQLHNRRFPIYKHFCKDTCWRRVYRFIGLTSTAVAAGFSAQIRVALSWLIFRQIKNFRVSPWSTLIGDKAVRAPESSPQSSPTHRHRRVTSGRQFLTCCSRMWLCRANVQCVNVGRRIYMYIFHGSYFGTWNCIFSTKSSPSCFTIWYHMCVCACLLLYQMICNYILINTFICFKLEINIIQEMTLQTFHV